MPFLDCNKLVRHTLLMVWEERVGGHRPSTPRLPSMMSTVGLLGSMPALLISQVPRKT